MKGWGWEEKGWGWEEKGWGWEENWWEWEEKGWGWAEKGRGWEKKGWGLKEKREMLIYNSNLIRESFYVHSIINKVFNNVLVKFCQM